jgi:hypothetical protein
MMNVVLNQVDNVTRLVTKMNNVRIGINTGVKYFSENDKNQHQIFVNLMSENYYTNSITAKKTCEHVASILKFKKSVFILNSYKPSEDSEDSKYIISHDGNTCHGYLSRYHINILDRHGFFVIAESRHNIKKHMYWSYIR